MYVRTCYIQIHTCRNRMREQLNVEYRVKHERNHSSCRIFRKTTVNDWSQLLAGSKVSIKRYYQTHAHTCSIKIYVYMYAHNYNPTR